MVVLTCRSMKEKMYSRLTTRILPGIIFITIGLDKALTHIDHSAYKVFISVLAVIAGVGLLLEGILKKGK